MMGDMEANHEPADLLREPFEKLVQRVGGESEAGELLELILAMEALMPHGVGEEVSATTRRH